MTPERTEQEREQERKAFEEWYIKYLPPDSPILYFSRDDTGYKTYRTRTLWEGWLARATQSEWISVKERLPESSGRYLVYDTYYIAIGTTYYNAERRAWVVGYADKITHWQPLPAPPTTNPAA